MEKHISLAGILNIAYYSLKALCSLVIFACGILINYIFDSLLVYNRNEFEDVPMQIIELIPILFFIIGIFLLIISITGLIGAIGIIKRKEWGRIIILITSFINLLCVPLGTLVGIYSIWVLFKDEIIRIFNPAPTVNSEK